MSIKILIILNVFLYYRGADTGRNLWDVSVAMLNDKSTAQTAPIYIIERRGTDEAKTLIIDVINKHPELPLSSLPAFCLLTPPLPLTPCSHTTWQRDANVTLIRTTWFLDF